jgi:mycolipenoyl-CoA---2-(long-chain-fatty acyl)-trehalose mycolipenoyltransferase / long-chain-acyl-CoA---trehalose acyltransferase
MVALGPINSWQPAQGPVTTWTASDASREIMANADRDPLPPSFQQASHLRAAFYGRALGRQLPRLMVVSWDIPGTCDIVAMTTAINMHVRRHDTYHSAFGFENGNIFRRTIADPNQIEFVPFSYGELAADDIREHALTSTPDTLDWDCFTFGIIQKPDHFTFYASADHLHIDGMSAGVIFLDIHMAYQELIAGRPVTQTEVGGYRGHTVRQTEQVAGMDLSSPEIRDWIAFAQDTDGDWPSFPLELGDTWSNNKGDFITVELLNGEETEAFDAACRTVGARFSGGVMACAALAEHQLTGNSTYHGFTPSDTRMPGTETLSLGWFAGVFGVTVPIGDGCFGDAARAAQKSFDSNRRLAHVPLERVLEVAPVDQLGIKLPSKASMMVSFMDFRKIPLASLWEETNFGLYGDNLSHGGINMWVNRHSGRTTVTVSFPDNSVARDSVHRYIAALTEAFTDVARTAIEEWIEEVVRHANSTAVEGIMK